MAPIIGIAWFWIFIVFVWLGIVIIWGFATYRYGLVTILLALIANISNIFILFYIAIIFPLFYPIAILLFYLIVPFFNMTIVIASILRWHLKHQCYSDKCTYLDLKTGRLIVVPCKQIVKDGKYLQHTIDRISTKPYCKYIENPELFP